MKKKLSKKQITVFIAGLTAFLVGFAILALIIYKKYERGLYIRKLMRENIVVELPELDIKAPVLEGTDDDTLSIAAGHFKGTGAVGEGNFCIAAHSSRIYREYFNNLKKAKKGDEIRLYRKDKTYVSYYVTESFIVEPDEVWILDDFGDCRITLITCTDDGSQRLVVIGKPEVQPETSS